MGECVRERETEEETKKEKWTKERNILKNRERERERMCEGEMSRRRGRVREEKTSLRYTNVRGCGRRKIHDQDAIAMRDRTRKNSQTRLNQQICLSECHGMLVAFPNFFEVLHFIFLVHTYICIPHSLNVFFKCFLS